MTKEQYDIIEKTVGIIKKEELNEDDVKCVVIGFSTLLDVFTAEHKDYAQMKKACALALSDNEQLTNYFSDLRKKGIIHD